MLFQVSGFRGGSVSGLGEGGRTSSFIIAGFSIIGFLLGFFLGLPLERFLLFLLLLDLTSMNCCSLVSVCAPIVKSADSKDTFALGLVALFVLTWGRVRLVSLFLVQLGSNSRNGWLIFFFCKFFIWHATE